MIDIITGYVIPAAYSILPPAMASREATGMLLAIGLQESRFLSRRQVNGPARGFWQFELGGVDAVLKHSATRPHALEAMRLLRYYGATDVGVQQGLEHNDVLACVFARLLLWSLPYTLPTSEESAKGWATYLDAWRPGKPKRQTWDPFFVEAYDRIKLAVHRQSREA